MNRLPRDFYLQNTKTLAQKLLGKKLVRIYKNKRISGIITETEAYLGLKDKACHSYGGKRTDRVIPLYMPGGFSYVYFIYGMHYCFNVVARPEGIPEAVLIRALEPTEGIEHMMKWRSTTDLKKLTTGPAKLCEALLIDKKLNAKDLLDDEIFIEDFKSVSSSNIVKSKRINIAYAEEAADWPLRYYIKNNLYISKK